jgi:hypothetical protein
MSSMNMPARAGGEFFTEPTDATQRRYEALRAYLVDGCPAEQVAARFGYTVAALQSAVRDFRAGRRGFFSPPRPGPKSAPAKDAARDRVLALREAGHSVDEISDVLAGEGTPLNRTGVAEICAEEGLPRLWRRPEAERGGPRRATLPRAGPLDFDHAPDQAASRVAGLLLCVPDLVALDLPAQAAAAGYPATSVISATNYLLSLLALKLIGLRRVSHVDDLAADPGAAAFAGLCTLPKTTALTSYSYRCQHSKQAALLAGIDRAALAGGLADGDELNLDFHAVQHWGNDPVLERHYVPRRSQRTRSVLTFFAEDATTHTLLYANADLTKASQNNEVIAFCDHWRNVTGRDPALLVFDSKLTTQHQLATLDQRGVRWLTLRARNPHLTATLAALPAKAWTRITLDRASATNRTVRIIDDPAVGLSAYPATVRQIAITGLGHDDPTILITNDRHRAAKALIERYAKRMDIEQRLAEAIRSFGLDALAGTVPLNIDLDVVLCVLAHTVSAALRRRLPGYATATPDTLQRRFLHTSGLIINHGNQTTVRLDRRAYSPVLRQADIPTVTVPWWNNRTLRFEYA